MDDAEKYQLLAHSLRERASLPALASQRRDILALAAHFERLAARDQAGAAQAATPQNSQFPPEI